MLLKINQEVGERIYLVARPSVSCIRTFFPKGSVGCEVGVYRGLHSLELCMMLQPSKLYLVDTWDFKGDKDTMGSGDGDLELAKKFLRDMKCVEFVVKDSLIASLDFIPESLDWVYIDANHSYDNVALDVRTWTTKVKKGGIVAGHDVRMEGVNNALTELQNEMEEEILRMGDDWWFIKGNKYYQYII